MEELLALVIWLIAGIFKIVFAIFGLVFRLLRRIIGRDDGAATARAAPARVGDAQKAHDQRAATSASQVGLSAKDALVARARALVAATRDLGRLAEERRETRRFGPPLDALTSRAEAVLVRIRRGDGTHAILDDELRREELLLAILDAMVTERRSELADLLGDTDALASASYAPIVEFCTRRGIALSSDRAATIVGGDKLFFLSVDEPTGLAAIVIPESFTETLVTWPAIAHEIAHDFFRSVSGLGVELRKACELGIETRIPPPPIELTARAEELFVAQIAGRATNAWMEELFADAFGTMMLGPAYIETMSASFASPEQPGVALAIMPETSDGAPRFEEHPPGHVRVVVACRLLARMGYGKEADRLEAVWRKRHGEPDVVFAPLPSGRWLTMPEGPVLDRAEVVGRALYMTGLPCLRGQPLRSLAFLDFGPRENEQAKRLAQQFALQRPVRTRDPRLLVAGAVLATVANPERATAIYALAREAIVGVDAPRPVRRMQTDEDPGPLGTIDATSVREALILGELLERRPRARG